MESIKNLTRFKKGNPGKPKGATNKIPSLLRDKINNFLLDEYETVVKDFKKLKPVDKLKFYGYLLQFSLPKMKDLDHRIEHINDANSETDQVNLIEINN